MTEGREVIVVAGKPGVIRAVSRTTRRRTAGVWRSLRRTVERLLHPVRRWSAHRRLERLGHPRRIMVVCLGNICRSPYLEALLKRDLRDTEVESGGFLGPGRVVPNYSSIVAGKRGIDLSGHRSRTLTADTTSRADLLIVMEGRQARRLRREFKVSSDRIVVAGDLDPHPIESRTIRDPFRQPLDVFEACFGRLDRIGRALVDAINRPR